MTPFTVDWTLTIKNVHLHVFLACTGFCLQSQSLGNTIWNLSFPPSSFSHITTSSLYRHYQRGLLLVGAKHFYFTVGPVCVRFVSFVKCYRSSVAGAWRFLFNVFAAKTLKVEILTVVIAACEA